MENDPLFENLLGKDLFDSYTRGKWSDWDEFRTSVSDWEIDRYLLTI